MQKYTVFVGGIEVNDYYLTLKEAFNLADNYKKGGYKDVKIVKINN